MEISDRLIATLNRAAGENTDKSGMPLFDALCDSIRKSCDTEHQVEDTVLAFIQKNEYLMENELFNGIHKQVYAHRESPFDAASERAKARAQEVLT